MRGSRRRPAFKAGKMLRRRGRGPTFLRPSPALQRGALRGARLASAARLRSEPRAPRRQNHSARVPDCTARQSVVRGRAHLLRTRAVAAGGSKLRVRARGRACGPVQARELRHAAHSLARRRRTAELRRMCANGEPPTEEDRHLGEHRLARVPAPRRVLVREPGGKAVEIVAANGFDVVASEREAVPALQSRQPPTAASSACSRSLQ